MFSRDVPRLKIAQVDHRAPAFAADEEWEPRLDRDGRVCAYTRTVGGERWLYLPGLAHYRFGTHGGSVEALPERGASFNTIEEGFYRIALPMALHASDYEVLHASAVSNGSGVHVLCGASGAGKSTIAYALGSRGFEIWADDAVAFRVDGGRVMAVPLPFSLRLRGEVIDFFDVPGRSLETNGKTEVLRERASGPRGVASVSLLERGPESTITRLSAHEALPGVLYHSFYFTLDEPAVRSRMSRQFLDLVAAVPLFRVSLRPGLDAVADLLDDLERRVLNGTTA